MSRLKNNYENSRFHRFEAWMAGDTDILKGKLEIRRPEEPEEQEIELDETKINAAVYDMVHNRELLL